jgi:hypothetical protein
MRHTPGAPIADAGVGGEVPEYLVGYAR